MRRRLLNLLVDPVTRAELTLVSDREDAEGNVLEGKLVTPDGHDYVVTDSIPRFVLTDDRDQLQTQDSFGYKWQRTDSYESPELFASAQRWLMTRYGFDTVSNARDYFASRRQVLDAGSGSGFAASLILDPEKHGINWLCSDISSAIDVGLKRLGQNEGVDFIQADIMQMPFRSGTFDTIFSEGVLHHTPSTELALKSLANLLEDGGEILFYVYRKKGPIREFTDDHVREAISGMPAAEAWEYLRPLTKLGQALAELHIEVDVPEDIPFLGITAGRQDIQRFFYWNIAKVFWNEEYTFEVNHHLNFDWYHPRYAHRQTEAEIRGWCTDADLQIIHLDAQESGYTVRAIKSKH